MGDKYFVNAPGAADVVDKIGNGMNQAQPDALAFYTDLSHVDKEDICCFT